MKLILVCPQIDADLVRSNFSTTERNSEGLVKKAKIIAEDPELRFVIFLKAQDKFKRSWTS